MDRNAIKNAVAGLSLCALVSTAAARAADDPGGATGSPPSTAQAGQKGRAPPPKPSGAAQKAPSGKGCGGDKTKAPPSGKGCGGEKTASKPVAR